MSGSGRRSGAGSGVGWLTGLAVGLIVTSAGFALGIVAGVSWEEPGLVISWLAGETDGFAWRANADERVATDAEDSRDVSAAPPPSLSPTPKPAESIPTRPAVKPAAPGSNREPGASAGRFAVQVGAFAERGAADGLAGSLRGAGFPVYLSEGESGARWRVRVGPHATRPAAERAAERLKSEQKLPTWVLSEDS